MALHVGAAFRDILQLRLVSDSGVMLPTVEPVALSTPVFVQTIVTARLAFLQPVNASCMSVLIVVELAQFPVNDPLVQAIPANVTAPVVPVLAPGGVTVAPAAAASAADRATATAAVVSRDRTLRMTTSKV
ncbi:hypothetical protein [Conexibacter woesei]|uniref:hypothetical protein n=1 Tax=Conexibacter woesei TaxID=191495 RepID=UPI00047E1310|nr:hypothetical protein [Conexibacter woesei]